MGVILTCCDIFKQWPMSLVDLNTLGLHLRWVQKCDLGTGIIIRHRTILINIINMFDVQCSSLYLSDPVTLFVQLFMEVGPSPYVPDFE